MWGQYTIRFGGQYSFLKRSILSGASFFDGGVKNSQTYFKAATHKNKSDCFSGEAGVAPAHTKNDANKRRRFFK